MRFELGTYFAADRHTNNLAMHYPSPAIITVLYLQLILAVFILQSRVPCVKEPLQSACPVNKCRIYTPEQCKQIFFLDSRVSIGEWVLAPFMNAPWHDVPAMLHP